MPKATVFMIDMLHVWLLTKDEMGDLETFKPFTREKQLEMYVVSELNISFHFLIMYSISIKLTCDSSKDGQLPLQQNSVLMQNIDLVTFF